MDVWRGLQAVRQRKWLFALLAIVTLAATILVPRAGLEIEYASTAKLLLTPPSAAQTGGRAGGAAQPLWFAEAATLNELITSERLLGRVVESLKLPYEWTGLKDSVSLDTLGGSRNPFYRGGTVTIFSVTVRAADPESAQKIASALVDEFVRYVAELSAEEYANTRRFLEELVAETRENVEATEDKLLAITAAKEGAQDESAREARRELEAERMKLKEEVSVLQTELSVIQDFLSGTITSPPWSVISQDNAMLKNLEGAVSENRLKLLELEEVYTPQSKQVVEQRQKLQKVEELYRDHLDSTVSSLASQKSTALQEKQAALSRITSQLIALSKQQLTLEEKREVAKLERELSMWEESHLSLVQQLYQARVVEQSSRRQGAISVMEKPSPGVPAKDKKGPSLLMSLAVGLPFSVVFSLGVVLLLEFLNSSLRVLPRIEESLQLPVLAIIPTVPEELAAEWEEIKLGRLKIDDQEPS
ncbi:MAG: GumC family protein [Vulcanimicrobiota bacterium]